MLFTEKIRKLRLQYTAGDRKTLVNLTGVEPGKQNIRLVSILGKKSRARLLSIIILPIHIFSCARSSLRCRLFLQLQRAGATCQLRCEGLTTLASPAAEHGLQGLCDSVAAVCGFSSCGSPGSRASALIVIQGLNCSQRVGSSWTSDLIRIAYIGMQIFTSEPPGNLLEPNLLHKWDGSLKQGHNGSLQ